MPGGNQNEDGFGELTGKATNLEFCETSQFSSAVYVVFWTAQAKRNTFVGQIQSISSPCAASDGWALLFAFRVSSFISSLKALFPQLLIEQSWCARKFRVPSKCTGYGRILPCPWAVGMQVGQRGLSPASAPSLSSLSLISGLPRWAWQIMLAESQASFRRWPELTTEYRVDISQPHVLKKSVCQLLVAVH